MCVPSIFSNSLRRWRGMRCSGSSNIGQPSIDVDRVARLEAALQLLRERALARADRAHQVEHLAALLALQRGGVEVADDLRDRPLDAEELVAEEVVDLDGLVLVEALHPRIVGLEDVGRADLDDDVVDPRVRELRKASGSSRTRSRYSRKVPRQRFCSWAARSSLISFSKTLFPFSIAAPSWTQPGARATPRRARRRRESPCDRVSCESIVVCGKPDQVCFAVAYAAERRHARASDA